ncbi:hypothetical protein [Mycolicibacterium fortuitum]|uniref:hypothetical protein n=1 Tax=Mycolicibacterium fortuitum TaxID=1766 RepID=UPI001F486F24|nr:hypothetical protein [Mycolicibacterium fortuitum]
MVRDHDGRIRAFHNLCRRRGHALVPPDFRATELRSTGDEFECSHCGRRGYGRHGRVPRAATRRRLRSVG